MWRLLCVGIWPLVALVCGCAQPTPPAELLEQARAALAEGEFDRAEDLARRIPATSGEWVAGRLVAGEAATRAGRLSAALESYRELARGAQGAEDAAAGHFYAGEVYRELGQLAGAEQEYRAVLARSPENAATHERLAFLLSAAGRCWEAVPHYWFLLRSGTASVTELIMLADPDRPFDQREYLQECARRAPGDGLVQLGLAAYAFRNGELCEAEPRLRSVVAAAPELIAAQAMLGELLVDRSEREFLDWHQGLAADAAEDPDIWYVRGLWARRQGELRVAARCFWESVRRAPTHRRATWQLGQVLTLLGEDSGTEFTSRASLLIQLTHTLDDFLRTPLRREQSFRRATELLEEMGRVWEACAWALAARQEFPTASWPDAVFQRLSGMLGDDLPLTSDAANLALRHDLSAWPGHEPLLHATARQRRTPEPSGRPGAIRFMEQSAAAGIDFIYYNGPDPATRGARMFEQTGGGVAVLDFDLDGWPDLYFTQGGEWHPGSEVPAPSDRYTDRLFRNQGDAFVDVTSAAGLGCRDFGQGPSAGDFDNDGFPDLYVANVGHNRLYHNNGDGTFTDVTPASGLVHEDWTASCVIVDLDGDGTPDLFDVNYVRGPGVYTAICQGRACSPTVFDGAPDRLHLGRGDGTFRFVPDATPTKDAKGLGVVVAELHDRGRPSLFIANDQVPNFLLRNDATDGSAAVRLADEGVFSGLAYNEDGIALAAMGIAADDVSGNGLLDFFVTNFQDEANTLYVQDAPGLFVDATSAAGLRAPSWPFVGWGTQFLDADLDGEPDLVVVNGHVDDYRDEDRGYHMRPQFFRNTGGGRFVELFADDIGPWFAEEFLGRGLARLDWNRDGRMDFVVSNIGARASLVTNVSEGVGRFLNVRLHATTTARDAIGSVVEVTAGGRRWTKQLVAGDGYMASNERVLQFGLGEAKTVEELRVHWPSGAAATLQNLPVDATIQVVEGAERGFVWRGFDSESVAVPLPPGVEPVSP